MITASSVIAISRVTAPEYSMAGSAGSPARAASIGSPASGPPSMALRTPDQTRPRSLLRPGTRGRFGGATPRPPTPTTPITPPAESPASDPTPPPPTTPQTPPHTPPQDAPATSAPRYDATTPPDA